MSFDPLPPRIVCAALRYGDRLVIGVRHFDQFMQPHRGEGRPEQGFIDQHGRFYDRAEAFTVAMENGQIVRRCGGDEGCLFSENLY